MNLYLIRHGKTDWNCPPKRCQGWRDIPINATGRKQAGLISKKLRGKHISVVYTSHLLRARQTAEVISDKLQARLFIDKRLAEANRGKWEGLRFTQISKRYPDLWRKWKDSPARFEFPDGESLARLQKRAVSCINSVVKRHSPADVLIVSHGGPIRSIMCHVKKMPLDCFHRINFPNTRILKIKL